MVNLKKKMNTTYTALPSVGSGSSMGCLGGIALTWQSGPSVLLICQDKGEIHPLEMFQNKYGKLAHCT
jgi:hypothetical protein